MHAAFDGMRAGVHRGRDLFDGHARLRAGVIAQHGRVARRGAYGQRRRHVVAGAGRGRQRVIGRGVVAGLDRASGQQAGGQVPVDARGARVVGIERQQRGALVAGRAQQQGGAAVAADDDARRAGDMRLAQPGVDAGGAGRAVEVSGEPAGGAERRRPAPAGVDGGALRRVLVRLRFVSSRAQVGAITGATACRRSSSSASHGAR
ncbi:hypothetical protein WJ967_13995 [Achromobacter xylosoxidans]